MKPSPDKVTPAAANTPASGFEVTISCTRTGCGQRVTDRLDTLTEEEAIAMLTRDLNGQGWQVTASVPILCPRHRPAPGVTAS